MAKVIIDYDISRLGNLHCDNPRCGHDLPDPVPFTRHMIGFPCPKCGESMLTERDFESTQKMLRVFDWLNKWFGWLGAEKGTLHKHKDVVRAQVRVHNDEVTFRERGQ